MVVGIPVAPRDGTVAAHHVVRTARVLGVVQREEFAEDGPHHGHAGAGDAQRVLQLAPDDRGPHCIGGIGDAPGYDRADP